MLRQNRFFISAALVAVLFISALILSKPNRVKACPPPQPATLLELYLRSDLIVVADVKSEKDGEKIIDEKDYYSIEIDRNLNVSSVLKGKTARNLVFTKTEYRDKNENNENAEDTEDRYYPYGYRGVSELTVGEKYLFFFTTNDESGRLELADHFSGVKKLDDSELAVHRKRLAELKKIVETKENQLAALTDWLIRLVEEPATRWDGVMDLTASFQAVEYKDGDEAAEPFVIDEDFNSENPAIAENLSDSQKDYISSIYFSSMPNFFNDDAEFYDNLSNLVSRWDKSRMLAYAYGVLQVAEQTDSEKSVRAMNYISDLVDDEQLNEIFSRYQKSDSDDDGKEIADNESLANTENQTENKSENQTENKSEVITASVENIAPSAVQTETAQESASPKKLTPAQKRENALRDFRSRYEYLLATNFAVEAEPEETAQN